jgi:hypothetical protein
MINANNVGDILPFLIQDPEVFNKMKNDFSAILADLVTFKDNPNCSCKGRVIKFFVEQIEANPLALEKYIKDPLAVSAKLQTINDERQANNYAGRTFTIPKGEESWKNFSQELKGKMFKMFSVVERENEIVVYFL